MAGIAKKLDSKGRLVLGPQYANATVLVEQVREGEFKVQTAAVVPVREAWLYKNNDALDLVQKGLEEAKAGKLKKAGPQKKSSWIDKLEG